MEETPAESSEDELVAPSQVSARVELELVAAALDFSYSLGRVSKILFSGPWARSCLGDALSRMEPQLLPWGLGKRCRWSLRHAQIKLPLRSVLRLICIRTDSDDFLLCGGQNNFVESIVVFFYFYVEPRLLGSRQAPLPSEPSSRSKMLMLSHYGNGPLAIRNSPFEYALNTL